MRYFLIHDLRVCLSSLLSFAFLERQLPAASSVRSLAEPRLGLSGWDCSRRSQSFEYGACLLLVGLDMSVSTVFPILFAVLARSVHFACLPVVSFGNEELWTAH